MTMKFLRMSQFMSQIMDTNWTWARKTKKTITMPMRCPITLTQHWHSTQQKRPSKKPTSSWMNSLNKIPRLLIHPPHFPGTLTVQAAPRGRTRERTDMQCRNETSRIMNTSHHQRQCIVWSTLSGTCSRESFVRFAMWMNQKTVPAPQLQKPFHLRRPTLSFQPELKTSPWTTLFVTVTVRTTRHVGKSSRNSSILAWKFQFQDTSPKTQSRSSSTWLTSMAPLRFAMWMRVWACIVMTPRTRWIMVLSWWIVFSQGNLKFQ